MRFLISFADKCQRSCVGFINLHTLRDLVVSNCLRNILQGGCFRKGKGDGVQPRWSPCRELNNWHIWHNLTVEGAQGKRVRKGRPSLRLCAIGNAFERTFFGPTFFAPKSFPQKSFFISFEVYVLVIRCRQSSPFNPRFCQYPPIPAFIIQRLSPSFHRNKTYNCTFLDIRQKFLDGTWQIRFEASYIAI